MANAPTLFEHAGMIEQPFLFFLAASLRPKAAHLMHRLGRQAQVSHDGNSHLGQAARRLRYSPAAFDLHPGRAALLHQPAGVAHGIFNGHLIGEERHVDDHQRAPGPLLTARA